MGVQRSKKNVVLLTSVLLILFSIQTLAKNKIKKPEVDEKPPIEKLKAEQFTYFFENKYINFSSIKDGELIYSSGCKNRKCDAVRAAAKQLPFPAVKKPGMYNPGPAYCSDHSGKPVIALDKAGSSFDFCRFKDGSLVDSWSLLLNHYPKNVIK